MVLYFQKVASVLPQMASRARRHPTQETPLLPFVAGLRGHGTAAGYSRTRGSAIWRSSRFRRESELTEHEHAAANQDSLCSLLAEVRSPAESFYQAAEEVV